MNYPIVDVSSKVFSKTHLAIRFMITLMMWCCVITAIADQTLTPPVSAQHTNKVIKI